MAHSNELCEFVMTNHGLDLLEGAAATPRVVDDIEDGSAEGGARHAVV
jgi:hypothetical protein